MHMSTKHKHTHLPTDLGTPPRGMFWPELPERRKKPLERSLVTITAAAPAFAARRSCAYNIIVCGVSTATAELNNLNCVACVQQLQEATMDRKEHTCYQTEKAAK